MNEELKTLEEGAEVSTEVEETKTGVSGGTVAAIGGLCILGGVLLHKYVISPVVENWKNRKGPKFVDNEPIDADFYEDEFEEDSEETKK